MKGINSTGAPLVHVPGWVDGWVGGWVGGCKSRFKDCLQQSKTENLKMPWLDAQKLFTPFYAVGKNRVKVHQLHIMVGNFYNR
jgi:hypothetical protein